MYRKKQTYKISLYLFICCILFISINYHLSSEFSSYKFQLRNSSGYEPAGLIALWSGPINEIPEGWKLCDGTSGTLNISNRFAYNTGNMEEPGTIGGSISHNHTYTTVPLHNHGSTSTTSTPHSHGYSRPSSYYGVSSGSTGCLSHVTTGSNGQSAPHSHEVQPTGETECYTSKEENIIPPYYSMAFIKKDTNNPVIPIGVIVMWASSTENIPAGWELCNGSNGTPDLRGYFIRGVAPGQDPGKLGGSISHNHTYIDIPLHTHSLSVSGANHGHNYYGRIYGVASYQGSGPDCYTYSTGGTNNAGVPHTHTVNEVGLVNCTTQNADHLPMYFKIAFIMNTEVIDVLPMGSIAMWGDSITNVPSGWYHCNGSYGTPDMLNRFPRGIETGEQAGITGGSDTHRHIYTEVPLHTHTVLSDPMIHSHQINSWSGSTIRGNPSGGNPIYYSSSTITETTTSYSPSHNHNVNPTGSSTCYTSYENNLPPYIKLVYIKKCLSIYNPSPSHGATGINYNPLLSVDVSDDEGDDLIVTFYDASNDSIIDADFVFGGSGIASVYWLGLSSGRSHSWYVEVEDSLSTIKSDTWVFTTNYVPNKPVILSPYNASIDVDINPILSVDVSDNDGDDLTVSFYNASDNGIIDIDIVTGGDGIASVIWSELSPGTTYSWYTIVDDGLSTNQSDTWIFTTNNDPNEPINPFPHDGATNIDYDPILSVDVSDEDADDLKVLFYDASSNNIIDTDNILGGSGTALANWSELSPGTKYSWYVITNDSTSITQSDIWSFTTNYVPNEPINPIPSDGASDIALNLTLSVEVSDDDGDDLTITFYNAIDDSVIDSDFIMGGSGMALILWLELLPGTNYTWYVIVDDGLSTTRSNNWLFTTIDEHGRGGGPAISGPNILVIELILLGTIAIISVKICRKWKRFKN